MSEVGACTSGNGGIAAVLLDLDGVITHTAALHARAWKQAFDPFLERHGHEGRGARTPFEEQDYRRYVDGKPRYDGAQAFLASRGLTLAPGSPSDAPGADTVCGLANQKNRLFQDLLAESEVPVFEDALVAIQRWKAAGLRIGVVSSSRNSRAIVARAGLAPLLNVCVGGEDIDRLGLAGKPSPAPFLEGARRIGVPPAGAVVVEDAVAGVQAGRRGGFAWVVGVDRGGAADALREAGADEIVARLDQVQSFAGVGYHIDVPHAMQHLDDIAGRAAGGLALFFDYDGTLTPIVARPEWAELAPGMRGLLQALSERWPVAIVSGRDPGDVAARVGLESLIYAGSHGMDIIGPGGLSFQPLAGRAALPALEVAEQRLRAAMRGFRGSIVERKRFAVAVHFRNVEGDPAGAIAETLDEISAGLPGLRRTGGKKVFELQPDIDWDKGRALCWLLRHLHAEDPAVQPIYLGDDQTDEDAFRVLVRRGVGIHVGERSPTRAHYRLKDQAEVEAFLAALLRTAPHARLPD